ncbi:MAG: two pore domain potassium channel family protein [Symploca sp. SIO2B6]|nr:two pore domain potassium channel family protein [Symploca sp. SIO2B6]
MQLSHKTHHQKYQNLLFVLIVDFLVSPFLKSGLGSMFSALLLLCTMLVIIHSFKLQKFYIWAFTAIAIIAFIVQVNTSLEWFLEADNTLSVLPLLIFSLYFGGAVYWISRDLFTVSLVTVDTIKGGISVYLLIGYIWAFLYGIVEIFNSNAFSQPLVLKDSFLRTVHFSFTTLTTLGYGDIVPNSEVAQVLTNLEAIMGQVYSTIFVAILVSNYIARKDR